MNGLLTDLYELTMAAGYFEAGKSEAIATFELTVRRLPKHRNYVVAAGLQQALDYLQNLQLHGGGDRIPSRPSSISRRSRADFFDYLRDFRFTGDLFAVPEGTPMFAGEPIMTVRAPLMEAQIPETYLLSTLTFQTLIATKAARMVRCSGGARRGGVRHAPRAYAGSGRLGARAAYIGGCIGTTTRWPDFASASRCWARPRIPG